MSLVNNFLRHRFLIERLRMAACSLGDFEDDLAHSGEYAEVKSFSKRTLQRDIKDIREIYHIDIQYNKSIKKYEIVEDNDLYAQNLFEAFDVFRALQNHGNLSKLIAFDHRYPKGTSHPAGTQHLSTLLQAIKQKKQLQLHYYKFWGSKEVQIRTIEPYLLKESQHRWYVLALDVDKKALRVFGLDRIRAIEDREIKRMQRPPQGIERFFDDSFGVWVDNDRTKAEKVTLSFRRNEKDSSSTPNPAEYLRAMPLHHSQVFLKDTPEEIVLSLQMKITPDFVKEILSYGAHVKVVAPEHLAERVKSEIKNALQLYDN